MAYDIRHQQLDEPTTENYSDDKADAFAVIAVLTIVVATVAYWLSGMPV